MKSAQSYDFPPELRNQFQAQAFSENVSTLNISQTGVLLSDVQAELNAGDTVALSHGPKKARFSVKWLGKPGTAEAHKGGLLDFTNENPIGHFPVPAASIDPQGRNVPAGERRTSPRRKCMNSVELQPDETEFSDLSKVVSRAWEDALWRCRCLLPEGKVKMA